MPDITAQSAEPRRHAYAPSLCGGPPEAGGASHTAKPVLLGDAHFQAPICRNCGADLDTAFCAHCGQKKVERIRLGAIRTEVWEKLRLFEREQLQSALRLLSGPGKVARDYVCGQRKRHVHPLKLLLLAIALLLLVLARTRYLDSANVNVSKAMELVKKYAEWSFSLGLIAILASSWLGFRRRLGYNLSEHLVLALYTHCLIVVANIVNLLPLLLFRAPIWLAWHKQHAATYMSVVELVIVVVALRQFFLVDLRRQGWRLLVAAVAFVVLKKSLLYAYAWMLVTWVLPKP